MAAEETTKKYLNKALSENEYYNVSHTENGKYSIGTSENKLNNLYSNSLTVGNVALEYDSTSDTLNVTPVVTA